MIRLSSLDIRKESFIKKSQKSQKIIIDYSNIIYKNQRTKITFICPEHGPFKQRPDQHQSGKNGCKKCVSKHNTRFKKGIIPRNTHTKKDFVRISKNIHGDRYDYSKVIYKNSFTSVEIICPVHKEFWQVPSDHKSGCGCPKCSESKGERRIREYLQKNNISFLQEYKFKELGLYRFDFYIPELNTCIEYDGRQHFEEVECWEPLKKVQKRDEIKNQYCKDNNITLIRIPFTEFKNINNILKEIK